jgi:hypothetical protein
MRIRQTGTNSNSIDTPKFCCHRHAMRQILSFFSILIVSTFFTGCADLKYSHRPQIAVGEPYPVEIRVSLDDDEAASGAIYYRLPGTQSFVQAPLQKYGRGEILTAEIPTRSLRAGDVIEYYLAIRKGNEDRFLGSDASPFRVQVLTRQQIVSLHLSTSFSKGCAGEPVSFYVNTGGFNVISAFVTYQAPGIPGHVTAPMVRNAHGSGVLTVPGSHVQAGWWNYRVDVQVDDTMYGLPPSDWYSFQVEAHKEHKDAKEHSHKQKK